MARESRRTSWLTAPLALALAWIVPGAGHAYLGRVWQGAVIFVIVGATFWTGIAIGGVMTVDSVNERWWFVAQMLTGGHGLVSYQRQQRVWAAVSEELNVPAVTARMVQRSPQLAANLDQRLARRGLALTPPADTVARAYSGVAGMLNLMCMFDALMLALMGAPAVGAVPAGAQEGRRT